MSSRLHGKTVLITGASSGIGAAAARAFVRDGARVLAVARSKDRLDALASEMGGPSKLVPLAADVADPASMQILTEGVLRDFGTPDVVVANAGIGMDARFLDTGDAAFRSVFETNVLGVVRTVRPFLPGMLARGSGRVLVVSSVVGKRGVPNYSAYSASKFALHGMADAIRAEIHGSGVTVGVVCPSSTETEFRERAMSAGPRQHRVRVQRHSAESVARALVKMAATGRREMVLSPEAKLMAWTNKFFPGLLDGILHRVLVRGR